MLPDNLDVIADGLGRLKTIRKGKPVIEGLLQSWLFKLQDVVDSGEFLKNLSIFNALGEDLDRYGRLYGVERLGREDDEYRGAILGFISAVDPDCSPSGIIQALKSYGQTDLVDLHEHFPCFTQVYMGEGFTTDMYSVVKTLAPAGTGISLLVDELGDSIVLAEELVSSRYLIDDTGDVITLDIEDSEPRLWGVDTLGESSGDALSEFAEEGDLEFHPFAEELNRGVLFETGYVLVGEDEFLIDEDDNKIIFVDYRFKD